MLVPSWDSRSCLKPRQENPEMWDVLRSIIHPPPLKGTCTSATNFWTTPHTLAPYDREQPNFALRQNYTLRDRRSWVLFTPFDLDECWRAVCFDKIALPLDIRGLKSSGFHGAFPEPFTRGLSTSRSRWKTHTLTRPGHFCFPSAAYRLFYMDSIGQMVDVSGDLERATVRIERQWKTVTLTDSNQTGPSRRRPPTVVSHSFSH